MGLLDFLQSEEAQLGLGLLGAAGPRSDGAGFGQRLQEGMGYVQAQRDAKMKREFMGSQMDNYRSEIEARKLATIQDQRKQAMIESMFGGGQGAPGASVPGGQSAQGGAPQGGQPNLMQLAKQLGIPEQAIQADMAFNGGKKISELLAERSKPNWQNVNGNLVNTNAEGFAGGLQGGMASSADGKLTAWQPDGKGGLVVGAPAGAVDTFRAYQGAAAGFKPIKVHNPQTGRDEWTSEGAVVGGQGGTLPNSATAPGSWAAANPGAAGVMRARPGESDQSQIYASALTQAQQQFAQARTPEEKARAQSDVAGIQGEMSRLGMRSPAQSGNFAAGPSADEAAQADANRARLVGTATADVQSTQGRQAGMDGAMNAFKLVDQALAHPGLSTATGLSGKIDPRNYIPGTNASNFDAVAKQLQGNAFLSAFASLKGAGQITEVEGAKATAAIARLQQSQSTEEYKSALKDYQDVLGQGLNRMGIDPAKMGGGATGSFGAKPEATKAPPPQPMKGMIRGGYKFKGGEASDQSNWEKM